MPSSLPPWVRDLSRRDLWLRRLRTVGLGTLLLVDAVYASGGFDGRRRAAEGLPVAMSDTASGVGMLIALLGMALMVTVAWRQRWPVMLMLVGCAATLVQLGPTAALIGLLSVVICRPLVDAYRLAPLVVAATFFAVSRPAVDAATSLLLGQFLCRRRRARRMVRRGGAHRGARGGLRRHGGLAADASAVADGGCGRGRGA